MHCGAAWIAAACIVATATAQNAAPNLSGILSLLGGAGGNGGGPLAGGLGGGAGGLLGNSQISGLLKPVLDNLGIDTDEVQANIQEDDRRQRLLDNIRQSKADCSDRGYSKAEFSKICSQANFTKFIIEDIPYGEPTFNVMFEGESAKYEYIRQNLYMCAARQTLKYYTTTELQAYMTTSTFNSGSRKRGKDKCLKRLGYEKETCDQLRRLLCAFSHGEPLECRTGSEINKQHTGPNPTKRYTDKLEQPLTSVWHVRHANFSKSIAHGPECDRYSLELETADLIAQDRAAKEEERRSRNIPQDDGSNQASPPRREEYTSDRGPELTAQLNDEINGASSRTRGNGRA